MFNLQPTLESEFIRIEPLQLSDFERLFKVASDPLIWEQHPNKDRYKREVFETFFKGAIESGGAFLVFDNKTNEVIGSSRFYDFDAEHNQVLIGYTFFARSRWGSIYNLALKSLMINHAFQFVNSMVFHVGAGNIRSQKAIEKLGAMKVGELEVEYYGESVKLNFVYEIKKEDWVAK
ncbi:MAG: GNAT family N-acetyltransferase [Bacteroidota bacterium]